jgi:N utilization substance protein B
MPSPAGKRNDDRKANRRGAARLAAVQALYQMDVAAKGLNEIFAEFESHWIGREVEGSQYLPAEAAFFRDIRRCCARCCARVPTSWISAGTSPPA